MNKFTKSEWKQMPIVSQPTSSNGQVRIDDSGDKWLWRRSNGRHVWADPAGKEKPNFSPEGYLDWAERGFKGC